MTRPVRLLLATLIAGCFVLFPIRAAENDWAEGSPGTNDGATRDYYNRGGVLPWNHYLGDWRDADNAAQGNTAYASTTVYDNDTAYSVDWDVTGLVREWVNGTHQNQGLLLRNVSGGGTFRFRSREYGVESERPTLSVVTPGGTHTLAPDADTYLESSTYQSLGNAEYVRVSSAPALLRFDLSGLAPGTTVSLATLRLHTYAPQYGGTTAIGVFRCAQGHDQPPSPPVPGLASNYVNDAGLAAHPDVLFFEGYESADWRNNWTHTGGVTDTVDSDPARRFEPLQGKALRARIPAGGNTALNDGYHFLEETGSEPEEIYWRYYLRLGDDWNQTVDGGKLPGIAGTYGVGGWGGRTSDGTNGWSARGLFKLTIPDGNPLAKRTPIGFYCYHADQSDAYGDNWLWVNDYLGFLSNNVWTCIEQYGRLNTPGVKNGVLRTWVNGHFAFEKTDIRFRDVSNLKIEEIWLNVYHGGTALSPYDQHVFIDNVVIARQYIGPMLSAAPPDTSPPNGPTGLQVR
ncbi:MAG: DNRLRE domain-containing protein [Kiritimatiellae bacterium]|nr:DNRLRE domain-containing protein [Kiritimatiellia bacterium]